MRSEATCRTCGAAIRFVRTTKGKLIPIDRDPAPNGNIEIVDGGKAFVHGKKAPTLLAGDRYVSHFATCEDADSWRSK